MPASQHQSPKSDIEISQAAKKTPIMDIARERLGIAAENLEPYGHYKAKVSMDYVKSLQGKPNGKLILVSAITPTPAGEGKTTTTVGLTDALNHIGKKAMLCLREPSLGPSFGMKGGAAGGGYAQVDPDGGHQPPLHRRLPRHHVGAQPARRDDRQPHLLGQRARHRPAARGVAARHGHERPRAALDRLLARRRRQRLPARGRLRHHGRVRGHGDLLPRPRPRRPQDAPRQHRGRLYPRPQADPRVRHQGARRHDGAAQGGDRAQPGADARRHARLRPRRPVRQHRPRLQLGARDHARRSSSPITS